MPLIDSNLASAWDGGPQSLYRLFELDAEGRIINLDAEGNVINGGYRRSTIGVAGSGFRESARLLIRALESVGMTRGQHIALVGAAFGFVAEEFLAAGYGPMADGTVASNLAAIDTSTWIHDNKNQSGNAKIEIMNADVNAATGRRAIKQAFGSPNATVHWAISEDVLPILSDNECGPFTSSMRQLADNVVHWVSVHQPGTEQDARLNWKSLETWKALLPNDRFVQTGTARII